MNVLNLLSIFILIILPSLCSCRPSANSACVKNSTYASDLYPPYFKSFKVCAKNLTYTLVPLGDNFVFDCGYDSNPPSEVFWSRFNKTTGQINRIDEFNNSSKLIINSVNLENEGHYTCTVRNPLGLIHHSFFLHVNDKPLVFPIFKHKEEEFTAVAGDKVKLDCTYETEETSTLRFYKANKRNNFTYRELVALQNGKWRADYVLYRINASFAFDQLTSERTPSTYSLSIDNVSEESFGIYMCVAKNRYGKSVKFIDLKQKTTDYWLIVGLFLVCATFIILFTTTASQFYRKNRLKKKLMIEKHKSYIIKKKIIIDYYGSSKYSLIGDATDAANLEMNSYSCPVFPRVEIVRQRQEIVGKMSEDLNRIEEFDYGVQDPKWETSRDCLILDETIGQGEFGVVQRGLLCLPAAQSESNRPTYTKDDAKSGISKTNKTTPTYANVDQLNYNFIIDHFEKNNLTSNITAFSNNYYSVQGMQFEPYGRLEFPAASSGRNETNNNQQPTQPTQPNCRIVAVKKLKQDYTDADIKNFVVEMEMMKMYSNHENIINLIGVCTQNGPLYMIMEYAERGNLKDFLGQYRSNNCCLPFTEQRLTSKDLISFALQIAHGMQHLAANHCIHRDLAARNVLVTSDLRMKVADFGLSRNTGDLEYYRKSSNDRMPFKWLAPECIKDNLYTVQTDVWSFGVTLWEITSLGKSPYEKLDANNMYLFLESGRRMGKPLWCNDEMYELMLRCWSWNSKDRPTFSEIIQCLESMYTREVQPNYIFYQDLPTPESSINSTCREYFEEQSNC